MVSGKPRARFLVCRPACCWFCSLQVGAAPDVPMQEGTQSIVRSAVPGLRKRFLLGFLTNATNPKGIIFMVAVLPQFITHDAALLPQLLILAATMCTVDLAVMHGYAFAASSMQRFFHDARAVKKQNRFFGGMLMAVGATLFFVKRTPAA